MRLDPLSQFRVIDMLSGKQAYFLMKSKRFHSLSAAHKRKIRFKAHSYAREFIYRRLASHPFSGYVARPYNSGFRGRGLIGRFDTYRSLRHRRQIWRRSAIQALEMRSFRRPRI